MWTQKFSLDVKRKSLFDLSKSSFGEAVHVQMRLGVDFVLNSRRRSEDSGMFNC